MAGVQIGKRTAKKLLEIANKRKGHKFPGLDARFREAPPDADTITVYNASPYDVPEFGILELDGTVRNQNSLTFPPDVRAAEYVGQAPYFSQSVIGVWNKRVVVAQAEIKKGETGQCKISGVTPVKIYSEKYGNPYECHVSSNEADGISRVQRMTAQYVGTGQSFPILWREQGTGEKWGIIDLKHFDLPGHYVLRYPINITPTNVPVTYTKSTNFQANHGGAEFNFDVWRGNSTSRQMAYHLGMPFSDQLNAMRVGGLSFFHGILAGYFTVSAPANNNFINSFPHHIVPAVDIWITVEAESIFGGEWRWRSQPAVIGRANSIIGWTTWSQRVNFSIPFFFYPPHNLPVNQTDPLRINLYGKLYGGSYYDQSGAIGNNYFGPNFQVSWEYSHVQMHEVAPPRFYQGPGIDSNSGGSSGGIVPSGFSAPADSFSKEEGTTPTADDPLSTRVNAEATETLSAPFGGAVIVPVP